MAQNDEQRYSALFASGGIISRKTPEDTEILVIHRFRYNDWCLPKGKLEKNESFEDAALREVKEETGYDARITGFAGCVAYEIKRKQKVVLFWTMEPVGNCFFEPSQEVKEIKWMDVSGALEILNYPKERELLMLLFGR